MRKPKKSFNKTQNGLIYYSFFSQQIGSLSLESNVGFIMEGMSTGVFKHSRPTQCGNRHMKHRQLIRYSNQQVFDNPPAFVAYPGQQIQRFKSSPW